ncbi:50S ribosomal protein L23 [Candidatus Uhrbacteria bacterium CG_4_9_14_0_2_um_filter_41_50]|uniref:Large ribosomal subunit protein uL23 n=1 Tax=Candidatus Uhrbacteria bacterium CG_4_9_14_0_2_um_filter_41_50 TaxID=1975031 RepID=A0A2M8EQ89_9BACT|nr:MAG: 50S ribosomal protein L23 [Candidatus Uhrbacteria bacterium CG_4_10_14_3_um_filter_41_21]PIZ55229.1 MAG: 50S ribosomal protein L23 [Candidatus Uhrbacteria bacterium CG_4_10_14_0_2_um_filter_41_21]PJB84367.1 MAG: 50S ribosomal protein L23 [Candidatus Uhrbacteria bacterium CG_4_9_14_0_8_um_filter_41_16]PJC24909.1 MAG: 50S ribosomal protein L23 [Candidatus Uhrbacteria bacterium CG_4_9_14_0_2_um_filter_41_50]PJE74971.1 MAG: 50S ribosomal protein L23 [Candidatus Uhrbacteria bacterium CG10_bi
MALFKKKITEEDKSAKQVADVKVDPKKEVIEKKSESDKKKPAKKSEKSVAARGSKILLGPVVTEKTAQMSDKNVIVFNVSTKANRIEVRNEIRAVYGVTPEKVNIINSTGKRTNFGRKEGKRIDTKKAMITLPKGKSIDIFDGV